MEKPVVRRGTWIKIKSDKNSPGTGVYIFEIFPDRTLSVGYYQNNLKAIKTEVAWAVSYWKFKHKRPGGLYLRGPDAAIAIRSPI